MGESELERRIEEWKYRDEVFNEDSIRLRWLLTIFEEMWNEFPAFKGEALIALIDKESYQITLDANLILELLKWMKKWSGK